MKNYFIICDGDVIDSDFSSTALILMISNSKDPILIKTGQRIAQIVFHKKEVVFKKVHCLSSTERGAGGFVSKGISFFLTFFRH